MALGETIGYCTLLSQNNDGIYVPTNFMRGVHVSLLGDPTLRMHVVTPPSSLFANTNSTSVVLSWAASPDSNLQGYHVYRAAGTNGPFLRLNTSPILDLSYTDPISTGSYTYMVRAIKLESSPSGTYYNPSQGVFAGVTLATLAGPTIAPNTPSDITVVQGGTATFTVTASSPSPINYQWYKGTAAITNATNSFLTLTAVQPADAGTNYNVVVANTNGSAKSRLATLTVLIPPSITSQPVSLTVPSGSTAAFHVTAAGSAPLAYQWYLGSIPMTNGGRFSGATSSNLTLTSVQPSDQGSYRVTVTNSVGAIDSQSASLTVSATTPPTITTNPVSQTVILGAAASFSVSATGTPPLNYQWFFNQAPISGATGTSFTIPTTSAASVGNFQVAVWNAGGTNRSTVASLWLNALKIYNGINAYGPVGSNSVVQYTTNLTAPVVWNLLQTVTIITNPTVVIDYASPDSPQRLYRIVPQ